MEAIREDDDALLLCAYIDTLTKLARKYQKAQKKAGKRETAVSAEKRLHLLMDHLLALEHETEWLGRIRERYQQGNCTQL